MELGPPEMRWWSSGGKPRGAWRGSREVLDGVADPHASPVHSSAEENQRQENHHRPGSIDPPVLLGLFPGTKLEKSKEESEISFTTKELDRFYCESVLPINLWLRQPFEL